ncbi:hypothetical protein C884_00014 [Kocuria palustris PEL]|uniref:Uncharacterized protein n=1 Tax=Kocuria palustris PEL TaxID=1236550 RepID=M2YH35_9MICC|nr:hypothetical protein C884_00014 [Kocuria palustris PEL]
MRAAGRRPSAPGRAIGVARGRGAGRGRVTGHRVRLRSGSHLSPPWRGNSLRSSLGLRGGAPTGRGGASPVRSIRAAVSQLTAPGKAPG